MEVKTRIVKYGKLREKVDQEIKIMKLKEASHDPKSWVPNYDEINEINPDFFLNAIQYKNNLFPVLKPFLKNEEQQSKLDFDTTLKQLENLQQQINDFSQPLTDNKQTLADYIPNLTNERFLRQKQENLVYELTILDEVFQNHQIQTKLQNRKSTKLISKNEIINEIVKNNRQIDEKIAIFEKIGNQNKRKTVWILFTSLFLIIAIASALMVYFWWNVK